MEDNKYIPENTFDITLNMYYEWDGWDWIGWSLGGVRYRVPYSAHK